jgi:hypothetical protein
MKAFLSLLLLTSLTYSHAKTLVISDIDDTIKDSEVLHKIKAVAKAFQTDRPFKGMSELYSLMDEEFREQNEEAHFYYVSNAPDDILGVTHNLFIVRNGFPNGEVVLREKLSEQNHKMKTIEALLQFHRPDRVILIGDNGERDPEIYHTAVNTLFVRYGVKESHQYIRMAYPKYDDGKPTFKDQTVFTAGGEIGADLYLKGLLGQWRAQSSLGFSMSSKGALRLPEWVDCSEHQSMLYDPTIDFKGLDVSTLGESIALRCD